MHKFDIAIMNPPYDGNLHLKILEHVIPVAEETINISPCTWAAPHNYNAPKGKWRQKLAGKIDDLEFIEHRKANDIFGLGNAIEDLAIMRCVNGGGKFDIENFGFKNKLEASILKKINPYKDENIMNLNKAVSIDEYGAVNGKNWGKPNTFKRVPYDVPVYQWNGSDEGMYKALVIPEDKAKKHVSYALRFKSEKEKQNFLDSLKTTFMDWYYFRVIVPGDCKLSAYAFRFKDYTKPWTNERFCEYFGITGFISDTEAEPNSEWEEILNTMKQYE